MDVDMDLHRRLKALEGTDTVVEVAAADLMTVVVPSHPSRSWPATTADLLADRADRTVIGHLAAAITAGAGIVQPVEVCAEWDYVDDDDDDGFPTGRVQVGNGTHRVVAALQAGPATPVPVRWTAPAPEGPVILADLTLHLVVDGPVGDGDVGDGDLAGGDVVDGEEVCWEVMAAIRSFPTDAGWVEAAGMAALVAGDGRSAEVTVTYPADVDRLQVEQAVVALAAAAGATATPAGWVPFLA